MNPAPLYAIYKIENNKITELHKKEDGFKSITEAIKALKKYGGKLTIIEYYEV